MWRPRFFCSGRTPARLRLLLIDWAPPAVWVALVVAFLLCSGCSGVPRIKLPRVGEVVGMKDQGKPAELTREEVVTVLEIPKESRVTATRSGDLSVEVTEPTVLRQTADVSSASTGSVDASVAQHRITEAKNASLGRTRIYVGVGLILAGIAIGFALPPGMRWPLVGTKVAGIGVLLVLIPQPPTWLIVGIAAAAAAVVYTHYLRPKVND